MLACFDSLSLCRSPLPFGDASAFLFTYFSPYTCEMIEGNNAPYHRRCEVCYWVPVAHTKKLTTLSVENAKETSQRSAHNADRLPQSLTWTLARKSFRLV